MIMISQMHQIKHHGHLKTILSKKIHNGFFKEIAISSIKVSPLFYWKLFLVGRMNPYEHKPLGDGHPIASSGYRRKLLSTYTQQPVSIDGDNVKLLNKALRQTMNRKEMSLSY